MWDKEKIRGGSTDTRGEVYKVRTREYARVHLLMHADNLAGSSFVLLLNFQFSNILHLKNRSLYYIDRATKVANV